VIESKKTFISGLGWNATKKVICIYLLLPIKWSFRLFEFFNLFISRENV